MKRFLPILALIILSSIVFAQTPEKMSYQAVLRDADNNLVTNQSVGMQISILQGSANGSAVYIETQTPTTNGNGLVSIEIGSGSTNDDFSAIDWINGPYFIKTETDLTGGTNYTITGTTQLLSVPYALHAKTAETVTSGITETDPVYSSSEAANISATDITNLSNLSGINSGDQDISGIATNQQAIIDTAVQIRAEMLTNETDPVFGTWDKSTGISITESQISDLQTYLTSEVDGSVTNEIQALTISNDTIYLSNGGFVKLPAGFNGDFNSLTNVPANLDTDSTDDFDGQYNSLSGAPTNVSSFTNDAGYLISEADGDASNEIQALTISNDTIYLSNGGFVKLPASFDGDFNSLTNVPSNLDTDATDDFNGQYNSLSGAPTNVSTFTNDAGYLTAEADGDDTNEIQALSISNDTIYLSNGGFVKLPAGFDGDFNSLANVPANLDTDATDDFDGQFSSLTGAPTNVSSFTNDAGYLISEADGDASNEIQALSISNDTIYLSNGGFVKLPAGFNGDFNSLTNVPANIDTDATDDFDGEYGSLTGAPTNVSSFTNDVGYLTAEADGDDTNEIQALTISNDTIYLSNGGFVKLPAGFNGDFNSLTNVPANLDTDATDDFDGEYGSLTGAPTNVSSFTNDAGYLTAEADGDNTNEIQALSISNDTIYLSNGGFVKLPAGFNGDFNSLANVPANLDTDATDDFDGAYGSLTGAPTTVSSFTNDSGYLTTEADGDDTNEIQALSISNDTIYLSNGGFVKLPAGFDGEYGSLTGAPTTVSSFTNDSGYLTTEADGDNTNEIQAISISNDTIYLSNGGFVKLPAGFDGAYSSLTGAPTNVSSFTNDSGYLTAEADGDDTNEIELPTGGTNGQVLKTDGSGNYAWVDQTVDTDTKLTDAEIATMGFIKTTPKPQYYLGQDTLGGIVFYIYLDQNGDQHGLIVSKTETTAEWQNTGVLVNADRTEDGIYNMGLMTDSPAKTWIEGLGTDWYLPSIDELVLLWNNRYHANKALRSGGLTLLAYNNMYWSSTEYNTSASVFLYFSSGNAGNVMKTALYYVRAIRAF